MKQPVLVADIEWRLRRNTELLHNVSHINLYGGKWTSCGLEECREAARLLGEEGVDGGA